MTRDFNASSSRYQQLFTAISSRERSSPFKSHLIIALSSPPTYRFLANNTAEPYPKDSTTVRSILGKQILEPVLFMDSIEHLYHQDVRTFVEVGPKSVLTGLVHSILNDRNHQVISMDASHGKAFGIADLARTLAFLTALGHPVHLASWEDPAPPKKNRRMKMQILGANYRRPGKERPDRTSLRKTDDNNAMKKIPKTYATSPVVENALRTVQEGLKSMQALQAQTTEAHKKFLETQSEAGRSLQRMMESIQQISEASLGIVRKHAPAPEALGSLNQSKIVAPSPESMPLGTEARTDLAISGSTEKQPAHAHPRPCWRPLTLHRQPKNTVLDTQSHPDNIESTLLHIVSELTGYPMEMLGTDMDMESDLGIDSIKRVEILSTLEERLPNLPAISPEIMGSLKTLAQIVDALDGASETVPVENTHMAEGSQDVSKVTHPSHTHTENVQTVMIEIVSDLTGYPSDMLGLDMDIEADLGIDSIKRVEILSTLEDRLPGLPQVTPDIMGSLKTLGQICAYLTSSSDETDIAVHATERPSEHIQSAETSEKPPPPDSGISSFSAIERHRVTIKNRPLPGIKFETIPAGRHVTIIGDFSFLGKALVDTFAAHDIQASHIPLSRISDILNGSHDISNAAGLVILAESHDADDQADDTTLKTAFQLARFFAPSLIRNARTGFTLFVTVTRLDGAFGFRDTALENPVSGGLAALAKTAAIEWDGVSCKALDLDPAWTDVTEMAHKITAEILDTQTRDSVEIGLDRENRYTLELTPFPYDKDVNITLALDPGDVVLVTGGARGVTAAAAIALAEQVPLSFVLLGRSPMPATEPVWLDGLEKESEIKKAILVNEFNNNGASPKDIEMSYRRHMGSREITATLQKLAATGSTVQYETADIRNADRVASLLQNIRKSLGPIRAIIHGAGVIEDRLIQDKTLEQFNRVYETKVAGFRTLMDAASSDPLKYIVVFSSVAARFGNKGQVDYAMANEVLNKVCRREVHRRKDCRVIAVNWGPWDGGMVTPGLKREFQKSRIALIPMEAGARCMLRRNESDRHTSG